MNISNIDTASAFIAKGAVDSYSRPLLALFLDDPFVHKKAFKEFNELREILTKLLRASSFDGYSYFSLLNQVTLSFLYSHVHLIDDATWSEFVDKFPRKKGKVNEALLATLEDRFIELYKAFEAERILYA